MAVDPKLTQLEEENGLVFGLKWSAVGVLIALCLLAGCSSFFAAETPRYNTVVGERRIPAMNQQMAKQAAQQQVAPAQIRPPAPQPPQPFVQQAPVAVAPQPVVQQPAVPQRIMQPLPQQRIAQPAPPAVEEPSMMDQVTGFFWSDDPEPDPGPYPTLPPNVGQQPVATRPQQPLPPTMSRSQIEAEITALENELQAAQQQQAGLASQTQAPLLNQPVVGQQPASVPPSLLLPPPPSPNGSVTAPVIGEQAAAAHSVQAAPMAAPQPVAPINVPLAPSIQPAPATRLPGGLIPPDMQQEFDSFGYLPASRYQGRY